MEPVYVVLIINLIIWGGIFSYLFFTNKQLNQIKDQLERLEKKS